MVVGMGRFREHFRGFERAFVLMGGTACDAWMSRSRLPFRKTKDLDIVLVIEALDPVFIQRFQEFVRAGSYEVRQRQETGRREFYRFMKPMKPDYPVMLELFSRAAAGLDLGPDQEIVPVAVEEAAASLSAILMDDGYYNLVLTTRYDVDGVPMVGVGGLIPLKARAWLDLRKRKREGRTVDEDDIKKHRNDVFRLALTLPAGASSEVPSDIQKDLREFLSEIPDDSEDWPAISQALKETLRGDRLPSPAELRGAITSFFGLK